MPTALIVDDIEENLYFLRALLSANGYDVATAFNGADALALAGAAKPDLIITDILMPVMDGFALCRTCRTTPELADIPIIVYTATYTDPADEELALSQGADLFLIKPLDVEELMKAIKGLMRKRAAGLLPPHPSLEQPEGFLRQYNAALVRKLEDKLAELDTSQRKLKSIFEAASQGIITVSPAGVIGAVNRRIEEMFGYDRSELAGGQLEMLLPEQLQERHARHRRAYFSQPGVRTMGQDMELVGRRKDGSEFPVEVGLSYIEDSHHLEAIGLVSDITDRRRQEAVSRELAAIVSSCQDAIIGETLDGIITSWNPGAERMLGYSAAEIIGTSMSRLIPPELSSQLDRPDEIPRKLERLRHGERLEHFETTRVRKDGRRIEVSVTISPIRDSTGVVLGASVIARDITEQKRAEATLRESEERFRNMADTAPVMIWVCGPDKRATFFNKRCLDFTGRTMEEKLGDGWTAGLHPEDREQFLGTYSSSIDARQEFRSVFRLLRADGEYRWVLCTGVPRSAPDGIFAGYIGSCIDITDQKRAEETLRRNLDEVAHLNRVAALGEMVTSLAHELNQPLAAILTNAEAASQFINRESPNLARVRGCLTAIAADDERAAEVIKRLRALLKKDQSQASLIDLNEVVSEALRLVNNDAMLRETRVRIEPHPKLPPVLGDRVQLCQVVLNLLVNGLQAAAEQPPAERWILVRTAEADGGVELTVEDSGKGIAEGDLARVFEPFFTTKREGLGMGLSISQSIVAAHGGRVWVENSAGHGALFHCVLPVAQQATAASAK